MQLGKLIKMLESQPAGQVVHRGFGKPHSYRGYYDQVAFTPLAEPTTVGQMLAYARSAIGPTFQGYKGGDYTYDGSTEAWVAGYGETVEDPIDEAHVAQWLGIAAVGAPDHRDPFEVAAIDLVKAREQKAAAKAAVEESTKALAAAAEREEKAIKAIGTLLPENGGMLAAPVGSVVVVARVTGKKACGTLTYDVSVANSKGEVR